MPADYHMHLIHDTHEDKCPYTLERIAAYLQVAEKNGVQEIGITEHCHRFTAFRPVMAHLLEGDNTYDAVTEWLSKQFYEPLDEYVEVLVKAQQRGWPVKIGLEVDYIPGQEDAIREILAPYPWDYTLGSVHYIDTWGIDISPQSGWPDRDIDEAYRTYFQLLQQAAQSGLFDSLAHPDLIKKFGHRPAYDLEPVYAQTAAIVAKAGCAIEVSTAGLHRPVAETYPNEALLKHFRTAGVPITLGSDAHRPEDVGRDFPVAVELCHKAGYRTFTCFTRRAPEQRPLGRGLEG